MSDENIIKNREILPINITEELTNSYLDYAMSVIVMRALPDVRDGMKPVHRRVLFAMYEQNNTYDKPYKKSARIVGDVLGKYHPHGDTAVYDALVRLAQDFSMRYPLIDGQGNFGSIDGDAAAAMRYTEVRMAKISEYILHSLDEDTVDFVANYDNSEQEPTVFPTILPQLLINGQSGIAVGMATNIPPHNLAEIVDAVIYLLENDNATVEELMTFVKGPDFPTSGIIYGFKGISDAYRTGRGSIVIKGRASVETAKENKEQIIITELPYQVNKATLIERIAELVKEEEIQGITDIRDESNKDGIRVVIDVKRGENAEILLKHLYKKTRLQDTFGVNIVCIVRGVPKLLNLKDCLEYFKEHRIEVVTRRTSYRLKKAEDKLHLLVGLKIAVDNIDDVVAIIRGAENPENAKQKLLEKYKLTDKQGSAILEMRLSRLTALERDKIIEEYKQTELVILDLKDILANTERVRMIIKEELLELKEKFADERKTEIVQNAEDFDIAQLISPSYVFVTFSVAGYIKRVNENEFRSQTRAGKGKTGATLKESDAVKFTLRAHSHDFVLMFSNTGKVYSFRVFELPEAAANAKGKALAQILSLQPNEQITAMLPLREFSENMFIVMSTKQGTIKKSELLAFANIRTSGLRGITLDENDSLIAVMITNGKQEIVIATAKGKAIRFSEESVRNTGRSSRGVSAINIEDDDLVVAMEVINAEQKLLVVTEKGYGKRSDIEEYRTQARSGKGVNTIKITEKNGKVATLLSVNDDSDIMITTNTGRVIRIPIKDIKISGRVTQGIRLMRILDDEKIVSVSKPTEFDDTPVSRIENTEEEE